ncbi:hypothetical protein BDF19DRAFT_448406 [Syncephalis fuscata]|nr:hypothetical protein BDF19DRAFT_448406 [Syncephalis fuscata]
MPVSTAPPTRATTISVSKPALALQPWSGATNNHPAHELYAPRAPPPNAPPEIMDFFASIEEEQRFLDQHPALVESAVANTGNNPFHGQTPIAYQPYNPFRQSLMLTHGQSAVDLPSLNPFGQRPPSTIPTFTGQLNGLDLAVVQSNNTASNGGHLAVPSANFNPFGQPAPDNNNHYTSSNYASSSIYTAASSTSTSLENSSWALAPYM